MAFEQKPNTGSLFKNERKEADSHPDYKGSALVEGLGECWLDAWVNTSNNGTKYMSLKIKPKNADQTGSYARQEPARGGGVVGGNRAQPTAFGDLDDDVPFASNDPALERRVR